jgi:hypothetical protein
VARFEAETPFVDRKRVMGFAKVFNQFGKWEFYSGNAASLAVGHRAQGYLSAQDSNRAKCEVAIRFNWFQRPAL